MEPHDLTTEKNIEQRLSHIEPPRALFDRVHRSVTNKTKLRYTSEVVSQPSRYKVMYAAIFMKRTQLIGALSIVVLAGIAVAGYMIMHGTQPTIVADNTPVTTTDNQETLPQTTTSPDAASPAQDQTAAEAPQTVTSQSIATDATPADTIDATVDSILNSASADSDESATESNDGNSLNAELQNYSDLSTTSYEDTI